MSAFEDFIQVELPRRPWSATDPDQETIPVRRGAGPRQLEFVSLTDGQVLGKVAGTVQGVDIPGLGTGNVVPKSYIHTQSTNSDLWTINHNLSSDDYVVFVVDDNGMQVFPNEIVATSTEIISIRFNVPAIGKAVVIFAS